MVWGGEFGRTPFGQGDPASPKGRDHFGRAYSWWLAGGGHIVCFIDYSARNIREREWEAFLAEQQGLLASRKQK